MRNLLLLNALIETAILKKMDNFLVKTLEKITKKISHPKLIEEAFEFAKEAYKEKNMPSGENYIYHALRVTKYLSDMGLDEQMLIFGLLHDVMDDKLPTQKIVEAKAIENKFGSEIAKMTIQISELRKIRYTLEINLKTKKSFTRDKLEKTRKMFLALAGDVRVLIVELISRLDGLNFVNYLPEDKQKIHCLETLQIFVPLASRLGLNELRRQLEDTAFSHLFPKKFAWLKKEIKEEYTEREKYLQKFIPYLKKIFKKERIDFIEISYRIKSYWSTYKKLIRYDMDINRIYDLLALRIITKDITSCYKALGVLHKYFKPLTEKIKDYIAKPKPNGYRSLHTTVLLPDSKIIEVQIRTEEMHKEAEYGICAHWAYKEKIDLLTKKEDFQWAEKIPDFLKNFKIDFFPNEIFVFTPKGDIITLPNGSTPVDFAYAVHSEIGNRCELAKVNGKVVSLDHALQTGDVVEIIVNKNKTPSKDWLNFVKTPLAKSHIKKATEITRRFKIPLPKFIQRKIIEISEKAERKKKEKELLKKEKPHQIIVAGQKGLLTYRAKCCNPQPGDKISAYISKKGTIILHLTSCKNLEKIAQKYPEKIFEASWE